jgi:hypothetical protein
LARHFHGGILDRMLTRSPEPTIPADQLHDEQTHHTCTTLHQAHV